MTGFTGIRNFAAFNGFGTDVASAALPATLANSLIVAGFSVQLASGTAPSVTDSAGNSYVMTPLTTPGVSQRHGEIWYFQAPAAGITGATVHAGASSVNVAGVLLEAPADKPVRLRDTASRANSASASPAAAQAAAKLADFVFGILAYQATVASTQQEHLVAGDFATVNRVTRGTTNMFASAYAIAAADGATGPAWTMDASIATGEVTAAFAMGPVFTASPAGLAVAFDASGSQLAGGDTVVSYAWNFGDGQTGTGVSPSHTYGSAGTKTVTLTATYTSGDVLINTQTVTVAAAAQTATPVAVVSAPGWTVVGAGGDAVAALSDSDGSTYVQSPDNPSNVTRRDKFAAVVTPQAGTDGTFTVFCDVTGGTGTVSAKVYEGSTVRVTLAAQALPVGTAGQPVAGSVTFTLPAGSLANVTSYNALEVETSVSAA